MGKLKHNQSGFGAVEILIILALVTVIGGIGVYVWNKNQTKEVVTSKSTQVVSKNAAESSATNSSTKEYVNEEYGFSFSYPSTWKLSVDLKDVGRGAKEGTVAVTSPNGTIVHFDPNMGGKGGDCVDPATDTRTPQTCQTFTSYKVEKLDSSSGAQPIYYNQASLRASTSSGGQTKYYVFITNNDYFPTTPNTLIGAIIQPYDEITTKKGYVTIKVEGNDDAKNGSAAFFATQEVQEAEPILKSFKLDN